MGSVPNVKNQAVFRRICMESLVHNSGNILPAICTKMLIFGKDTFLIFISRMILKNPISSQILIFVTSHFTTLSIHVCIASQVAFSTISNEKNCKINLRKKKKTSLHYFTSVTKEVVTHRFFVARG